MAEVEEGEDVGEVVRLMLLLSFNMIPPCFTSEHE
jgi:hypothetical protein